MPELRFRMLLVGDEEARGEEYVAGDPCTGSMTVIDVPKLHTARAKVPRPADQRKCPVDS